MESVKKIKFWEHDCMCWEKDEYDNPLECDPFDCEINFCPIKQLIAIIQSSMSTPNGFEKIEAPSPHSDYEWPSHDDYDIYIRKKNHGLTSTTNKEEK